MVQEGISEEVTLKPCLQEVKETLWEEDSRLKEQHLQRPFHHKELGTA